MNQNSWWKSVLIALVVIGGVLVALPNLFGEDPALQISLEKGGKLGDPELQELRRNLDAAGVRYASAADR